MTAPAAIQHQLHLQLPQPWIVADPAEATGRYELARAAKLAVGPGANVTQPSHPDLVATFFREVTLSGEPLEIVIATLVAWTYSSKSLPTEGLPSGGSVLRDVEMTPGIKADFYVLTLPVVSRDGAVTTLLTFSTPNLPLAEPMDEAFRSIWSTAYLSS
jgi:hypothetical protein